MRLGPLDHTPSAPLDHAPSGPLDHTPSGPLDHDTPDRSGQSPIHLAPSVDPLLTGLPSVWSAAPWAHPGGLLACSENNLHTAVQVSTIGVCLRP